jgi:hypothetical protein
VFCFIIDRIVRVLLITSTWNIGVSIDLVLIDPQSVGKRTHDLMDTVNAKRDGRPFAGVSINI